MIVHCDRVDRRANHQFFVHLFRQRSVKTVDADSVGEFLEYTVVLQVTDSLRNRRGRTCTGTFMVLMRVVRRCG